MTRAASDHLLARVLADAAGDLLVSLREQYAAASDQERGRVGDLGSHDLLVHRIAAARPCDAVLSEEGGADLARVDAERVWIVDPLDGTREYGEIERDDWAVHVALWERGQLAAGAVAMPARHVTLATDAPPAPPLGAGREGDPIRVAVSRTRPPEFLERMAGILPLELVPMGSAGVKAMAVVTGGVDAYVHGGGQYEWDSAAPVAVAAAAGLHTSRIDGSPLVYNQADPRLPDLLVCRSELRDPLLDALARTR
jgi:3'(2'), 5'-bisphosphate nucleotidase